MLTAQARLLILIIAGFSFVLLLSTVVYIKSLHELNGIQAWVRNEIQTALSERSCSLTEEEQAVIDGQAKHQLKLRRFLAIKLDQELKFLALKQLDTEYRLANNHCAHLSLHSKPHQSCIAEVLQDLRESRGQFDNLLLGDANP